MKEGSIDIKKGTIATTVDSRRRRTPYGLITFDHKKMINYLISFSFRFVLRHRFHRGIPDPPGIQRCYLEWLFDTERCGRKCLSPEFISRLHPITTEVGFTYKKRKCSPVVTIYFQSNRSNSLKMIS